MILVCNAPDGVQEVLEYMQDANIDGCSKIMMRAKKSVSWQQLTEQPRYKALCATLQI